VYFLNDEKLKTSI